MGQTTMKLRTMMVLAGFLTPFDPQQNLWAALPVDAAPTFPDKLLRYFGYSASCRIVSTYRDYARA
jgi:hypothetical protein